MPQGSQLTDKIKLHGKEFALSITKEHIHEAVTKIACRINNDLAEEQPLFICVLNGSFMFAADLLKKISMNCMVSFIKLSSYKGSSSTKTVTELIGLNEEIKGKSIVIVEDIVDTGTTLESLVNQLNSREPKQVRIAALLLKPDAFTGRILPDYVGMEIPNDFVVGYGLDYNGLGRNYEGVYKIIS